MKLRVAKKVLRSPDRYSGHQHYLAAYRLFRRASRYENPQQALAALKLKPQESFCNDEAFELKYELLLGQEGRGEPLTFSRKPVPIPAPIAKPAFRRDGQIQNFNALPDPRLKKKDRISLNRYQVSDQNTRARPKRSVADFNS